MITAYLDNGRPHVSTHIEIPRLNITGTIPLLVDTGADNTCIHPKDGPELLIPYPSLNRPTTVRGIAGTSQRYLEEAVISSTTPTRSANGAWLAVQVIAHNLARWTARIGLGEQLVTTKTLRRRFFSLAGRLTRSARRLTLHLPQGWPWEAQFSGALARFRRAASPVLTAPVRH